MTTSKHRRENAWKIRKQSQQPHGKVPSLRELSETKPEGSPHE